MVITKFLAIQKPGKFFWCSTGATSLDLYINKRVVKNIFFHMKWFSLADHLKNGF
jgi:hypothetical protein